MAVSFSGVDQKVTMALPIVLPTALILIGEAFLFTEDRSGSIEVHLLNIFICVMAPILLRSDPAIWQAFLLVSMLRVLHLGMPRFTENTLYWMPMVYAPLIIIGFLLVRDESVGFRDRLRDLRQYVSLSKFSGLKVWYLPAGAVLALVLANIEFKILSLNVLDLRLVPDLGAGSLVLLFVVMVFFVGLGEELIFRFILQTRLEGSVGTIGAILATSLVFSAMHSGYGSYIYMVYVFCISLVLGSIYHRTGSLAYVALIHGGLNFFLFSLLPFGYLAIF